MDYKTFTSQIKSKIESEIHELLSLRQPFSLYEPMQYILQGGGKRIRPLLLILSSQSVGGQYPECKHAAVAVELLHTFTLVHDDIMDHDDLRRGRQTVHKKWDEPTAILAGDGLVTLAFHVLLKTRHPDIQRILQMFTEGLLILCEGQAMDKDFESQDDVPLHEYIEMIDKKTARLISAACEIGAVLGNGSEKERRSLKAFGSSLGRAFQIQDDLLDILHEESVTGKPLGSDIIEKKKTYLTIHFLNHTSQKHKEKYHKILERPTTGMNEILEIRQLFKDSGTFAATQDSANKGFDEALSILAALKENDAVRLLTELTQEIRNRIA